jgi:hypothetical protein
MMMESPMLSAHTDVSMSVKHRSTDPEDADSRAGTGWV